MGIKGHYQFVVCCSAMIGLLCTYQAGHHSRPLQPQLPHSLEHVHNSLRLQPLDEDADGNVGASAATPTTAERGSDRTVTERGEQESFIRHTQT